MCNKNIRQCILTIVLVLTVLPVFSQNCNNKFLRKEWLEKDSIVGVKEGEENHKSLVNVYPNPFIDFINLEINFDKDCKIYVSIYNLDGKFIKKFEYNYIASTKEIFKIDLKEQNLKNSAYIIKVNFPDREYSEKIVRGE